MSETDERVPLAPPPPYPGHEKKRSPPKCLNICHFIIGVLCLLLGAAFIIQLPEYFKADGYVTSKNCVNSTVTWNQRTGAGVWSGFVFIICGILGLVAGTNSCCLVVVHVMSSGTVFVTALVLLSLSMLDLTSVSCNVYTNPTVQKWIVLLAMCGIMVFLAALEMLLTIASSLLSLHVACSRTTTRLVETQPNATDDAGSS
ncbi:uncharacterized protein LOC106151929 [Lingula anatina]|uniref:Uncharacterized protein LOC106151929 n=1 Tax=Lingula anatina TaxID=7574 RepID=A0A1S3H3V4_LINAN|nr:uncharacterized protein LOC106151929 [Lingula anatina]|eukprot:XP_013380820.1 uncharacterized protein LOC106151929 [Lingula anatina]